MAAYKGPSGKRLAFPGPDTSAWANQVPAALGLGAITLAGPLVAGEGSVTAALPPPAVGSGAVSLTGPLAAGAGAATAPPAAAVGTGAITLAGPLVAGGGAVVSQGIQAAALASPLNQVWAPIATIDAPGMAGTPTWEIVSGGSLFVLGN